MANTAGQPQFRPETPPGGFPRLDQQITRSRISGLSCGRLREFPATERRSFLAHYPVAVAVPRAGDHRLRESSPAAFAALYAGFAGGLCRVARAVRPCSWCWHMTGWSVVGGEIWACLATVIHLELWMVGAGVEHLDEGVVFCLGGSEDPGGFDSDPVGGVLAPVRLICWFPCLWTACAFGTVGAGGDGDQVLGVAQIVCVTFAVVC